MPDMFYRASILCEIEQLLSTHETNTYDRRRLVPGCHPELMAKDLCQLDDATAQPDPSVDLALTFAEWVIYESFVKC